MTLVPLVSAQVLARFLVVFGKVMAHRHEKDEVFDQRPYHRFLVNLIIELNTLASTTPDFPLIATYLEITYHLRDVRPTLLPGSAFGWLEVISHRFLLPVLLKEPACWFAVEPLLSDLLLFLKPLLRVEDHSEEVSALYRGTLRVLLVLLHDFPEFLCEYHIKFVSCIPHSCMQMRNLILSAYPRTMKLPDPFTPNLKVDLLPEIKDAPRVRVNYIEVLSQVKDPRGGGHTLKTLLDTFLLAGPDAASVSAAADFLHVLPSMTMLPEGDRRIIEYQTPYNLDLFDSLVLYVAFKSLGETGQLSGNVNAQAPMDLFRSLVKSLPSEGRYFFLTAIANQLRYPNNHTHYFSFVLLYLFAEIPEEVVQEQITRVLVERLVVPRPHPWGLLITFIELIKNPRYSFWARPFTRIASLERLFKQVGASIATHRGTPAQSE